MDGLLGTGLDSSSDGGLGVDWGLVNSHRARGPTIGVNMGF